MKELEDFVYKINNLFPAAEAAKICAAANFASAKHQGQKRDSGEDYIVHPIAVANILLSLEVDATTIICGLLHECLENTDTTEKELRSNFGDEVTDILLGLVKLENIKRSYHSNQETDKLQKMFLALGKDARLVLVRLADRLHNMQTLSFKPRDKQIRIAQETVDLYVPLAERLGMYVFKRQMEELCFMYLYPEDYQEVQTYLNEYYKKSESIVEDITASIRQLAKENNIEARIQSRRKSAYSVFLKWQKKGKNIYDIIAHRVIVRTVKDCYTMLGAINSKWKTAGRIKDYIAHPKDNLYMSLHTTVYYQAEDKSLVPFEVQIRTEKMHSYNEFGVAAHWIYKGAGIKGISGDKARTLKELRSDSEINTDLADVEDHSSFLKSFYENKIFVFTPALNVIELPKESTPIDFAYCIHTSLGNKCVGAKVNGKMVPLVTKLMSGDVVEVITSQASKGPSRDWLKVVKSKDAVSKIKAFFKKEGREENIKLGKAICEEFAKRSGFTLAKLLEDKQCLLEIEEKYDFDDVDDMFADVGSGRVTSSQVLSKFIYNLKQEEKSQRAHQAKKTSKSGDGVLIGGHVDLLKKFAKCCNPIPGDEIVGYVSRGKGVTIHRKDCMYLSFLEQDRKIDAEWTSGDDVYTTTFNVIGNGHTNVISSITSKLGESKVELVQISLDKTSKDDVHYIVEVKVKSKQQLVDIMNKLRGLPLIYDVYR